MKLGTLTTAGLLLLFSSCKFNYSEPKANPDLSKLTKEQRTLITSRSDEVAGDLNNMVAELNTTKMKEWAIASPANDNDATEKKITADLAELYEEKTKEFSKAHKGVILDPDYGFLSSDNVTVDASILIDGKKYSLN